MKTVCLNGKWKFSPVYDDVYVDDSNAKNLISCANYEEEIFVPSSWAYPDGYDKYGYEPSDNFGYPKKWSKAKCGVLSRTFEIKKEELNGRVILHFLAVAKKSYVFVNGNYVSKNNDIFLPFLCDITKYLVEGKNTVDVLCTDFDSVTVPSGNVRKTGLCGSIYGTVCMGIWQDVYLEFHEPVYISDCEIVTSVRKSRIDVAAELFGAKGKDVKLTARIFDGEEEVMSFSSESLGEDNVLMGSEWENPILWDTENAHLYNMKITAVGEGIFDEKTIRFGFREFWAEGESFFLNGTRINLRGDSWHFLGERQMTKEYALNWCRVCKEHGVNSIRYHAEPHPEYYLDAADEVGMLIVDESAIYGSGKSMDSSHPDYIENCRDHVRRLVIRDRNHPSVVIWSLENEMRWVDGRDEFKKHIPELMGIMHANDRSGRLISLDGDNRLIDKAHTEIASLHYNIDGTVEQWDRKTPLTVGEHGGLWYICPQNSSMYMGLSAYGKHDECAIGISIKEQLYMEYARREYVSGISSFNFAHYFATAMPDKDVITDDKDICAPGTHPSVIRKYSLTINNGKLTDYPVYKENPTCKYATEGMRPVTVIPREYDTAFFDDGKIERNFDVYNDTLHKHKVRLVMSAEQRGHVIFSETCEYVAEPGIYRTVSATIKPLSADTVGNAYETVKFTAKLYHDEEKKFTLTREYKIYSARLRNTPVTNEEVAYYGDADGMEKLRSLFPKINSVDASPEYVTQKLLIIGRNAKEKDDVLTSLISAHIGRGGRVLICEQDRYAFGSLTISKKPFIRAHASDYSHPVLASLSDDDLMYWLPHADEIGPERFLTSAFEKPTCGNYNMLLECSYGDFNDGGDLWTPLIEYSTGNGALIASQLPIADMADRVPYACIILRNSAEYLLEKKYDYINVAALVNDKDRSFLDRIGVRCVDKAEKPTDLWIISPDAYKSAPNDLKKQARSGRVFVMPSEDSDTISEITGERVNISEAKIFALTADYNRPEMKGVSRVDMFGCDKPPMSPRKVENRPIARHAIGTEGKITPLASGAEDIVWEDLFILNHGAEHYKRALVRYKDDNEKPPLTALATLGERQSIVSEIIAEEGDEKSVRIYTRIFSNLGVPMLDTECGKIKGENRYTLEAVMALPYLDYQDYDKVFSYYSDPEFSLNNLGEGLYGWMQKQERSTEDGAFHIKNSRGKTFFCIAFVTAPEKIWVTVKTCTDSVADTYICGKKISCTGNGKTAGDFSCEVKTSLRKGVNPVFVELKCLSDDTRLSLLFRESDGRYAQNLVYRTTVDEIDPK